MTGAPAETNRATLLAGAAVADAQLAAEQVDPAVQIAPLFRHFLLPLGGDLVRERVEALMQLTAGSRDLSFPELQLLELDEHLVQVEEALRRHEKTYRQIRQELEGRWLIGNSRNDENYRPTI